MTINSADKSANAAAGVCRTGLLAAVVSLLWAFSSPATLADEPATQILGLPFVELSVEAQQPDTLSPGFSPAESAAIESEGSAYQVGISYKPAGGLGLHADAWEVEADLASLSALTPSLMMDPALGGGESGEHLRLSDISHDALLNISGGPGRRSRGIDLTASYVWESSRFGQFIVSTKATYVYNQHNTDGISEPGTMAATAHPALSQVPELQSSLMLSWQAGNHQATATTHYASDTLGEVSTINMNQLDELVGHIATLDLRYGYNLKSGRKNNTVISVGLRNTLDRRPFQRLRTVGGTDDSMPEANGSVAYGTIKYQF